MTTVRIFKHHMNVRFLLLGVLEAVLLFLAVYLGAYLRYLGDETRIASNVGNLLPHAVVFSSLILLGMIALGLYHPRLREPSHKLIFRTVLGFLLGSVGLALLFYAVPTLYLGRGVLLFSLLCAFCAVSVSHIVFFKFIDQSLLKERLLVLGAGSSAASILERLRRKSDQRTFNIVGCVSMENDSCPAVDSELLLHLDKPLAEYALENKIDQIVVALDERRATFPVDELLACRLNGIEIIDMITFYERVTGKIKTDLMRPSWIIFSDGFRQGALRQETKRIFDIAVSVAVVLVTWPIMLVTALLIVAESGRNGTVLYRQHRVGQGGKDFEMLKFRSMRADAEGDGKARWAKANDDRVTRVGAVIRKYRIDELPQLFNVLRGDMSFVGPRPERPEFVEGLSKSLHYYAERHRVKPGITGWAQLCYPYGSSERDALEKLQYDLYYVKNHTLFLDFLILIGTAEVVLFRKGAR